MWETQGCLLHPWPDEGGQTIQSPNPKGPHRTCPAGRPDSPLDGRFWVADEVSDSHGGLVKNWSGSSQKQTCSWIMASVPGTSRDNLRIAEGCGAGSFKGLLCRLTVCFHPAGMETWSLTPLPGRSSAPSAPSAASWWLPFQYRSSSPISAASTTKTRERTRWEHNRFFLSVLFNLMARNSRS